MKSSVLLLTVFLLFGMLSVGMSPVVAGDVSNRLKVDFEYVVDTYSSYYWIANLTDESMHMDAGSVAIYDNGSHIYIWVGVWSKPYLAYGELDKNGDGKIDELDYKKTIYELDKNGDGIIDQYDLKSDGIIITGLGNPYGTGKDEKGYRWKVDSDGDDNPTKRRDPEITVPSWDLELGPGGILDGPIVYLAEIPIPVDKTPFHIYIEVHASPPASPPYPVFVIPELPTGTLGAVSVLLLALSIFALSKRKTFSAPLVPRNNTKMSLPV